MTFDNLREHILEFDHSGQFKIGRLSNDDEGNRGYRSLSYPRFTFELIKHKIANGYNISINENNAIKFISLNETVIVDILSFIKKKTDVCNHKIIFNKPTV